MKIKTTFITILTAITALLLKKDSANYFLFIPDLGVVRARKTTQLSWQLYGIGIPKKALQERIAAAAKNYENMDITCKVFEGDYNIEMLESLNGSYSFDKSSVDDDSQDEKDKPESSKVSKKILDSSYKKKQIKNALTESTLWKKKQVTKIVAAITFDGKNATGYDILDGIDAIQGEKATPEQSEAIFSILS